MDNLTPSDLFSPSKARQQRAQAQDWAHIETWLSYKFNGRSLPTFERNEETLKLLRELSIANERADEERIVRERVEREALKELDEVIKNESDDQLLSKMKTSLTPEGEQALHSFASTAVVLDAPTANAENIAHSLIRHTTTTQSLTNQLAHIQMLQNYLTKQYSLLRSQLNELQSNPAFSPPPNIQRQTSEQARQIKHVRTKIREHEDRLSSIQSSQSRTMTPGSKHIGSVEAIGEMLEQQKALDELREKVERLETEVAGFSGLSADKESARKEVARLEVKLDEARRMRDDLFEGLVEKQDN